MEFYLWGISDVFGMLELLKSCIFLDDIDGIDDYSLNYLSLDLVFIYGLYVDLIGSLSITFSIGFIGFSLIYLNYFRFLIYSM